MKEVRASNGKCFALDRNGLVPLHTDWEGWGDQRFEIGALVHDGEHRWRICVVDLPGQYAGAELME